jgi:replicative DNA helicase
MIEYHSVETEQQLIGSVLMNNTAFAVVESIVRAQDFFEPVHREIWEICTQLIGMGKHCSPLTIRTFMKQDVLIGTMTLQEYLAALAADAATIVNAPDHARVIRDFSDRRIMIEVGQELQQSGERDNLVLSAWAVDYLDGIVASQSMSGAPAVDMDRALDEAMDASATAYAGEGRPLGVSYGLRDLDQKTLGALPGDLIVIAGRPGMGKTAIALGVLRNMAKAGHRCLFVSLEMGHIQLGQRVLSDEIWSPGHRLSYWQIASGRFREERWQDVQDARERLRGLPARIEQQPGLTVAQIGARARQYKRRNGLKALFVDHLGLVKPSGRYSGNKVQETGEITMGLKALAKELAVPVFLLCQINRGVEQREDKRPTLSDLRNSGDIEQDADTVMILYRPAYYLAKKEPHAASAEFIIWSDEMAKVEHRLDVGIEKQRSGPVGTVRLHCDISSNAVRDEISEMDDSLALSDRERADFQ